MAGQLKILGINDSIFLTTINGFQIVLIALIGIILVSSFFLLKKIGNVQSGIIALLTGYAVWTLIDFSSKNSLTFQVLEKIISYEPITRVVLFMMCGFIIFLLLIYRGIERKSEE